MQWEVGMDDEEREINGGRCGIGRILTAVF